MYAFGYDLGQCFWNSSCVESFVITYSRWVFLMISAGLGFAIIYTCKEKKIRRKSNKERVKERGNMWLERDTICQKKAYMRNIFGVIWCFHSSSSQKKNVPYIRRQGTNQFIILQEMIRDRETCRGRGMEKSISWRYPTNIIANNSCKR